MPMLTDTVEPGIAPVPGVCSRLVAGTVMSSGAPGRITSARFVHGREPERIGSPNLPDRAVASSRPA
jgi:hypothetical protein